ncbi:MAG: ECF-type sigma factor [Calditrichia bacterium]
MPVITFIEEAMPDENRPKNSALDEALTRLEKLNERQSKVIEYWFFGGLTHEEIADVLKFPCPLFVAIGDSPAHG